MRRREAIPILSRVLTDNNRSPILRGFAAKALGEIGDPSVNDILRGMLNNHEDDYFLLHILFALGKLGIEGLEATITTFLKHPDSYTRKEAVETLSIIGTVAANLGLIQALTDEEFTVRFIAACKLGRNGEQAAIPVLVEALGRCNSIGWEDTSVCEEAMEVLSQIGTTALLPLKEALNNSGYQVERNAEKAIRRIIKSLAANSLSDGSERNGSLTFNNFINELIAQFSNDEEESDLIESILSDSDAYWEAASRFSDIGLPEEISVFYELICEAQSSDLFNYILNKISLTQLHCQFYNYEITQLTSPRKTESVEWRAKDLLHNQLDILTQEVKKVRTYATVTRDRHPVTRLKS